jgi:predicted transcriptional regulator
MNILLSLLDKEKKVAELEKETHTRVTTILHALKDLEMLEVTTKNKGVYKLTPLGVLEAQICKECNRSLVVLEKHKNFWLSHDMKAIPPALMTNLGAIEKSDMIKATDVDLQKVHNTFIELLLTAKTVQVVIPIFHTDYIEAFKKILEQEGKIILITSHIVLEKIKQEANNLLDKYSPNNSLQIFLNENLKFALAVTEKNWSLGLFNLTGEYDYTNDLIGNEKEGLEWGHQLFNNVLEQSTKM